MNRTQRNMQEVATEIKNAGFDVYLSNNGEYGFYTDGKRVVSFNDDLGGVCLSGNYMPQPTLGSGWRLDASELELSTEYLQHKLNERAPRWATNGLAVDYTTPEYYLKVYGESSGFHKI